MVIKGEPDWQNAIGKTTLLQILGTLDKADEGSVIFENNDVSKFKKNELARFRNENIGFGDIIKNKYYNTIKDRVKIC